MICNSYTSVKRNIELPNAIRKQKENYAKIEKTILSGREKEISSVNEAINETGKYFLTKDGFDFHFFYSKNKVGISRKLFIFFFAARSFTRNGEKLKFRELPFFPRWSYSNFLDGDVLCIEDPMYYKHPELHVGWMFGSKEQNLLETTVSLLRDFIKVKGYNLENIYLIGSSCGGYAALQIGSRIDGCNVITVNPQIFIDKYKYYFNVFCEKLSLSPYDIANDKYQRFETEKLIGNSKTKFVIACNLLSKEDYNDQILEFANKFNV